jgi:hypothetical protein
MTMPAWADGYVAGSARSAADANSQEAEAQSGAHQRVEGPALSPIPALKGTNRGRQRLRAIYFCANICTPALARYGSGRDVFRDAG